MRFPSVAPLSQSNPNKTTPRKRKASRLAALSEWILSAKIVAVEVASAVGFFWLLFHVFRHELGF
jgi:hypothetical protein